MLLVLQTHVDPLHVGLESRSPTPTQIYRDGRAGKKQGGESGRGAPGGELGYGGAGCGSQRGRSDRMDQT